MIRKALRRFSGVVGIKSMGDLPAELKEQIYLVGNQSSKWVVLTCPCGCGRRIDVNLMLSRRPRWKLRKHKDDTVSLFPSLWMPSNQCGSHFWLLRNQVRWVMWTAPNRPRFRRQK